LLDALDDLVADPPLTARAGKQAHKQLPALVGRAARQVDRAARAVADGRTPRARDQGLREVAKRAKTSPIRRRVRCTRGRQTGQAPGGPDEVAAGRAR
jgi:hypothetical protein